VVSIAKFYYLDKWSRICGVQPRLMVNYVNLTVRFKLPNCLGCGAETTARTTAMITPSGPGRSYVGKCDGCGDEVHTGQKSFHQAVIYLSRVEGWRNDKRRGVWDNYCPRCAEAADGTDIVGIGFKRRPDFEE
jgi:hypothetical protein